MIFGRDQFSGMLDKSTSRFPDKNWVVRIVGNDLICDLLAFDKRKKLTLPSSKVEWRHC